MLVLNQKYKKLSYYYLMMVMLDDKVELHFLVDFPLHLHINWIVLLELLHDCLLVVLDDELDLVLLQIRGRSFPAHLFDQIVHGHVDGCASQSQSYDEALCSDLFSSHIEEQVDKALHHELLQSLASASCLIDQVDFLFELHNFVVLELLVADALLQLLVDHNICEPPNWRGEVGVVVKAESKVPLVGVQVARVDCKLLDLYGLKQQQLLESIVNGLLFEKFLELSIEVTEVVGFELHSQLRKVVIEVGQVAIERLGVVDQQSVHSKVIYQLLGHLAIRQNHELLHHLFGVDPFLEADVNGDVGLVQVKHHFVLVKYFAVAAGLPSVEGDIPQQQKALFEFLKFFRRDIFVLLKFFGVY